MNDLKSIRKESGLAQQELAYHAGISLAHLQNIESGVAVPTITVLEKIYSALGFKLTFLQDEISYDELISFGVPLSGDEKNVRQPQWRDLSFVLKRELMKAKRTKNSRVVDAIEAYLLALKTHFPKLDNERTFKLLYPQKINGHHIKLRRIAIELILKRQRDDR